MRRSEDDVSRTILNWKPMGKRPQGRPRRRRPDFVEKYHKRFGVQEWRDIAMAAKTLREYQRKKILI